VIFFFVSTDNQTLNAIYSISRGNYDLEYYNGLVVVTMISVTPSIGQKAPFLQWWLQKGRLYSY